MSAQGRGLPSGLQRQSYVFDPRPKFPYRVAVNRYWISEHHCADPDAITLIFAHGNGFHKELWEPTLEYLYKVLLTTIGHGLKIREAWCVDAPNHGDSAVLNDNVLQRFITFPGSKFPSFSWEDYARGIHLFLVGKGAGVDVDFGSRRLVGIGHSVGAVAIMLSTTYFPDIKFESVIFIEPMIVRTPKSGETDFDVTDFTLKRRDIWTTREEALRHFKSSSSFRGWNPQVLEKHAKYGLQDLPTAMYHDKTSGVTLKCHKAQQTAVLCEHQSNIRAYDYLPVFCKTLPVHLIYGQNPDYLPKAFQQDLLKVAIQGLYATASEVEGAGHLVVQMQPARLAEKVWDALLYGVATRSFGSAVRGKL